MLNYFYLIDVCFCVTINLVISVIVAGREIRDSLITKYKKEIDDNDYKIKLAIICIGDDEASKIYVRNKKKVCDLVGVSCDIFMYDKISKKELSDLIDELNCDDSVTGIMVELPLPSYLNKRETLDLINANKDVDGLVNKKIMPCTALAVLEVLHRYNINTNSKMTLVGYSDLIGKPLFSYFDKKPTVCNSKTIDLKANTKDADIIITGVGIKNLIKEDMVKENSVIIDCGIVKEDRLYGDVDFESVKDKCFLITPVPNGIGPITTVMVIHNLIELYREGHYE